MCGMLVARNLYAHIGEIISRVRTGLFGLWTVLTGDVWMTAALNYIPCLPKKYVYYFSIFKPFFSTVLILASSWSDFASILQQAGSSRSYEM